MKKTNDEEPQQEVVNKLVWRLKSTPTVGEVKDLLDIGVIDKDEARDILFKVEQEVKEDPASISDVRREIEFLRGLVLQVMNNGSTKTVIEYVHKYPENRFEWIRPYYMLANNLPANGNLNTVMVTSGTTASALSSGPPTNVAWGGSPQVTSAVNAMGNPSMGNKHRNVHFSNGSGYAGSSDPDNRYIS